MSDAYLKVKDNGASGLALIREETDTSVTDLKNALNQQTVFADEVIENGSVEYDLTYTNNAVKTTTGQQSDASPIRASTPGLYFFPVSCELHVSYISSVSFTVFCFDETGTYLGSKGKSQVEDGVLSVISGTHYFRFVVFNTDDSNISTADAKAAVTFTCVYTGRVDRIDDGLTEQENDLYYQTVFLADCEKYGFANYSLQYSNHAVNSTTGNQSPSASSIRASTDLLYYVPINTKIHAAQATGYNHELYGFDEHKTYIARYNASTYFANGVWNIPAEVRYIRILAFYGTNEDITPQNAAENITLSAHMDQGDLPISNNNLINNRTFIPGYYDTQERSSDLYTYVKGIPVKSGEKYYVYPRARMIYVYNNGSLVNYLSGQNIKEFTAEGDGTAYVTFYTGDAAYSYAFWKNGDTNVLPQNEYGVSTELTPNGVLNGKKWAVCGDSFTAGADNGTIQNGKYKGQKIVYPYLIGNRNAMNIVPFFAGGRTLAFPANPDDFVNSLTAPNQPYNYQQIPDDADYITIYLGINDHHHLTGGGDGEDDTGFIDLGTINDNTTETYYGAWNVVMSWLIENRPNAHIGIIVTNGINSTPSQETAHPTSEQSLWHKAQIDIAEKYGIPYIDLNGDARTRAMIRTCNPNIPDAIKQKMLENWAVNYAGGNYHPNNAAHLLESYIIEDFLRSI